MEDVGHLVPSLQVSVLAALCFDEEWGAEIASQVKPTHFDSIYRDFVTVLLRYRREYKTPPGEVQLLTLALDAALNNESKTFYTESLVPTLVAEATKFNARFAASKVNDFIRRQQAKHALFEAGEAWDSERTGGPNAIPRIERAFHDFLFAPRGRFDAGTSLSDPRALNFLDKRHQEEFIPLGIKEFDAAGIGLYPKQLLLYIGPKGTGKTWFCVHCGVQTLLHHGKVVHYTLEEDGDDGIIPRYCQALFGLGQNGDPYTTSVFSKESKEGEKFWTTVTRTPDKHFGSTNIKKFLQRELKKFDAHFERLIVKTVPSGKFTVDELVSHLDYLEYAQGFVPNLVIVDYPKLMRQDPNNLRISLGQTVVDLRAVAQERNMAFLCPHQGTRKTIRAARVHSSDAGEDISVVQTADTVLAYQRTIMEENRGMARLSVEHSRRTRSGWMLWLSQSYAIGKFVNESKRVAERDLEQPMQGERDDTEGGS